jgi:membrane-bound lytic murein transglycosylase D
MAQTANPVLCEPESAFRAEGRSRRTAAIIAVVASGLGLGVVSLRAAETSSPAVAPTTAVPSQSSAAPASPDVDALYQAGQQLFDELAPPEVKAQYEFPTKEQWDAFAAKLQRALESGSLEDLAEYGPQARALLTTLRALGADDDLADWLEQRLDEVEGAQQAREIPGAGRAPPGPAAPPPILGPKPPAPRPPPPPATPASPSPRTATIPYYDLWLARVRSRPVPARAAALMPTLREAFAAEGVPPALAWIAEGESSLNPAARSPSGAKGLFQLMPETARTLGLSTFLPDERTSPVKSARAAAHYLHDLHAQFGSWPLALAAYNAGAGRVSRALAARRTKDFAGIAETLPAETRMYVPKICALVATRTGESIAVR